MNAEYLLAHRDFVRGLARRLLIDESSVDDVEQQTWIAAMRARPDERSPRGWLATVTRNFAIQNLREEHRRRRREESADVPARVPTPSQVLARERDRRRVVDAVLALREPYRSVILLRFFEALSTRSVAERLGVPLDTAKTRLKRGLAELRGALTAEFGDERGYGAALAPLAGGPFPGGPFPEGVLSAEVASGAQSSGAATSGEALVGWMTMKKLVAIVAVACLAWIGVRSLLDGPGDPREMLPSADAGSDRLESPSGARGSAEGEVSPHLAADGDAVAAERASVAPESPMTPAVRGVVLDDNGEPIAGAHVVVYPDTLKTLFSPSGPLPPEATETTTGATGEFRVTTSGGGPWFSVLASARGYSAGFRSPVANGDRVVLTLGIAREMSGQVMSTSGQPIEGARVRWLGLIAGTRIELDAISDDEGRYRIEDLPSRQVFDADSWAPTFWIEVNADAYAPLMIEHDGQSLQPGFRVVEGGLTMNLVMQRGSVLSGITKDAVTGEPIANARVFLWSIEGSLMLLRPGGRVSSPWGERVLAETNSDARGRFQFERVPSMGFHPSSTHNHNDNGPLLGYVGAIRDGRGFSTAPVQLQEEGSVQEVEIAMYGTATVLGRVVDPSGQPIAAAPVWVSGLARAYAPDCLKSVASNKGFTDGEGRYRFEGISVDRDSPVNVRASRPEVSARGETTLTASVGDVAEAPDLELPSVETIVIAVVDGLGQGVEGATIEHPDGRSTVRTGPSGRATLVHSSSERSREYRYPVSAPGFGAAVTDPVSFPRSDAKELRVVLQQERVLHGVVRYAGDEPASHAQVTVTDGAIDPEAWERGDLFDVGLVERSRVRTARTGVDGRFTVPGLPAGPYHVFAYAGPSNDRATGRECDIADDREPVVVTLGEPPASSPDTVWIEGTVFDAVTSEPVLNCDATFQTEGEPGDGNEIRANPITPGRFGAALRPSRWKLTITHARYPTWTSDWIVVEPNQVLPLIEVRLRRGAMVSGSLRAPAGVAVKSGRVVLVSEVGERSAGSVNHAGQFVVEGVAPGVHRVIVSGKSESGRPVVDVAGQSVEVPRDVSEVRVDLGVQAASKVTLFVGKGEPARSFSFDAMKNQTGRLVITDTSGRRVRVVEPVYRNIQQSIVLPLGLMKLRFEDDGQSPIEAELLVEEGGDNRVRIELP